MEETETWARGGARAIEGVEKGAAEGTGAWGGWAKRGSQRWPP